MNSKLLSLTLLFAATLAFAQTYSDTALQNSSGNYARVVPFAPVTVCLSSDNAIPCTHTITTYTDQTLTTPCTLTSGGNGGPTSGTGCNNPGIADSNGNFTVFAGAGFYKVCVFSFNYLCTLKQITVPSAVSAGNPPGSLQGNNAGAFSGVPNSSVNFLTGAITLSAPFALSGLTQGTSIGTQSGGVFGSRGNEFHSADFTSPTLQSMLALCPANTSTTPCVIVLDPATGSMNAGFQTGTVNTQNAGTGGCASNCVTWVSGNMFSTSWTGSLISINSTVYTISSVQSTTLLTLASAPGSQTGSTFNYSVVIGSGSQWVAVENRGVTITCATGFGIDCIQQAQWGVLECMTPGAGGTPSGCLINSSGGQTFSSLLSNSRKDGLQTQFYEKGMAFNASCSSTYTRGIIDIVAVEGKGRIEDPTVNGCANQIDMSLEDGGSGTSSADNNNFTVFHPALYCEGTTDCISLNIVSGGGTGQGNTYTIIGWNGADAGKMDGLVNACSASANGCNINIDGSAAWSGSAFVTGSVSHYLSAINFTSLYLEGCTAGGSCVTSANYVAIKNAKEVNIAGFGINVGPSVTDCVYLNHSGSPFLGRIHITGREIGTHCTNLVHNLVTTKTLTESGNQDFDYLYPGEQSAAGMYVDGPITSTSVSVNGTNYGNLYSVSSAPSWLGSWEGTVYPLNPTADGHFEATSTNKVEVFPFKLLYPVSFNTLTIFFHVGQPAAVGVGVYDSSGNRLVHWDSVNAANSNTTVTATPTGGAVLVQPGNYQWAFACSTTSQVSSIPALTNGGTEESSEPWNNSRARSGSAANAMSAGVLPATLGTVTAGFPNSNNAIPAWTVEP
jgi:hypothetical protein